MEKKKILIVISIFLLVNVSLITFISAEFGYDNKNLPKVTREPPAVITFNNNTGSVNSSDWWDGLDTINTTQMENSGGVLNILISWLEDLIEGSFNSTAWQRSGTNVFLANIGDNVGIGTTTPTVPLSIFASTSDVALSLGGLDATGVQISLDASDDWRIISTAISSPFGSGAFKIFNVDTSVGLIIKNTGRVGIGIDAPEALLDVNGNVRLNNTLFVNESGNVGIGIQTPVAKLHVEGTSYYLNNLFMNQTNGGFWLNDVDTFTHGLLRNAEGDLFLRANSNRIIINGTTGNVGIGTTTPKNILNVVGIVNFTSNFSVDESTFFVDSTNNRIGIGTASPSDKLDVAGNARVDRLILDRGVQSPYLLAGTSKDIRFFTIDSERMRIKEGGNVGIGTSTPQNKLNVLGAGNFTGNLIIGTSTSPQNITMFSPDGTSFSCGVTNGGTFACV